MSSWRFNQVAKFLSEEMKTYLPVSGYASMNIIISSPVNPDNKHTLGNDFAICICLTQCRRRIVSIAITDNPSVIQQMLSQRLTSTKDKHKGFFFFFLWV